MTTQYKMKLTFKAWLETKLDCSTEWVEGYIRNIPIILIYELHSGDCTSSPKTCDICVLQELLAEYKIYYFDGEINV